MNTYTLVDRDYYQKESVLVEVETSLPQKTVVSIEKLNNTIEYLNVRKAKLIAEIDAEIAINQAQLTDITPIADSVVLKPKPI